MKIESSPQSEGPDWVPSLRRFVAIAIALGCVSIAALLLNIHSRNAGGVTILWPMNGLLLGVMLCAPRRHWPAYLALGFAVNLSLMPLSSYSRPDVVYLASCNLFEVLLAAALLYRTISPK